MKRVSRKAIWPDEVRVLAAGDICRWAVDGPSGTHSLPGWIEEVFHWDLYWDVYHALAFYCDYLPMWEFNDDESVPLDRLATIWNRGMADLGYDVVTDLAGQQMLFEDNVEGSS